MDVLVASHLYPSDLSRISGSFVHNQNRFLAARCRLRVVAPVPWFPLPGCGRWSRYRRLPRRETLDGIEVRRPAYLTLPRRIGLARVWRSYLRALDSAAGPTPDLVHGHVAYPDGRACVEYGARVGRPVVVTVHGHDMKDLAVGRPSWREGVRTALTRADAVIAVSGELAERVRALGVDPERVRQIPNGVDCELFRPSARTPGDGGWRLVYVGRYDPAKGLHELLEALAGLVGQGRDVRLDLVGGSSATGAGEAFRQQARALGVAERVDFVDEVPWARLPERLGAADVFVLPSHSEGLPLSLLEAFACGLPVVTTRCGGPEEVVTDAVGRLAEPRDVSGLQAALEDVLDGYARFDRAGIRRYAEARFDYRTVAQRIHEVYESVLSSSSSR